MDKRQRGAKDANEPDPDGIRVLVINDTPEILAAFKDILELEGYVPLLYSYAITNIDEVERLKPDLIILDYIFGGAKTGWQTLQLLKMRRSTAQIPVIICTAATHAVRDIEGYLAAHDIQIVPKPFDIDDLLMAVKRALVNADASAKLVIEREQSEPEDP